MVLGPSLIISLAHLHREISRTMPVCCVIGWLPNRASRPDIEGQCRLWEERNRVTLQIRGLPGGHAGLITLAALVAPATHFCSGHFGLPHAAM